VDEVTGLALAAGRGDQVALQQLVRATQAQVWRFCAHLAESASADDLTQEVYLRAIKALPRFRADASARTWLLAIARRTVADHIRAQQRRRAKEPGGPATVSMAPPDDQVTLNAVVAQLPEDRRTAFVLTQVLGLSYAETATVCRCPIGTVRSRVARARSELVAAISEGGGAAQGAAEGGCAAAAEGGGGAAAEGGGGGAAPRS
jgi:RNA polymerase sigma-70 factor (ECF subfamily)